MSESYQEQVRRVWSMIEDDGSTWDLSENDTDALMAVMQRLKELEEQREPRPVLPAESALAVLRDESR